MTRTSALIALAAAVALATAPESTATACARTVKVVYAGYGDMHQAACAVR